MLTKGTAVTIMITKVTESEVKVMTEEKKKIITDIVKDLKQLDLISLKICKSNAEVLKARDALETVAKAG